MSKLFTRRWIKYGLVVLDTAACALVVAHTGDAFRVVVLVVLWISVAAMIVTGRNWFREGGFFVRSQRRREAEERDESN